MEELVRQISDETGIAADTVRPALILVFKYLDRDAPQDKVEKLFDAVPGAREAMAASKAKAPTSSLGAFMALNGIGMGMGDLKPFARTFLKIARERTGADTIDGLVAAVPGLGSVV